MRNRTVIHQAKCEGNLIAVAKGTRKWYFVNIESTMASVEEAIEAILDDDFGLSDGGSSDEEGEDIYGYVGEPVLRRDDVNGVGDSIVNSQVPIPSMSIATKTKAKEASELVLYLVNVQALYLVSVAMMSYQQVSHLVTILICYLMMMIPAQCYHLVVVVLPGGLGEAVGLFPLFVLVAPMVGGVLVVEAVLVVGAMVVVVAWTVLVVVLLLVVGDVLE